MRSPQTLHLAAALALLSAPAWSQQAIDPDEQFPLPEILFQRPAEDIKVAPPTRLTPLEVETLSQLRAKGIDPSWVSPRIALPSFEPMLRSPTQNLHPLFIENWATQFSHEPTLRLHDSINFRVGRTTELRDGNISGSKGSLGDPDAVASFAQSEGEYNMYNLSLEWEAVTAGPVTLSVLSGLKAIEANIGKRISRAEGTEIESVHRVRAMPMIGSGVRWQVSEDFSFSGAALTQPLESGDTLIDLSASTDLQISRNVGFVTGYRIIRSDFQVGGVDAEIDQEGLFARFEIKF